jgi:hypothetical protein
VGRAAGRIQRNTDTLANQKFKRRDPLRITPSDVKSLSHEGSIDSNGAPEVIRTGEQRIVVAMGGQAASWTKRAALA